MSKRHMEKVHFVIESGRQGLRSENLAAMTETILCHPMDPVVVTNPTPLGTQMVFESCLSFSLAEGLKFG